MALTLGTKPDSLKVLLNPGGDFMAMLRPKTGSGVTWPDGVRLELVIGSHTWTATVTANAATFIEDADEVDAVIAEGDLNARLWYVQPGVPAQHGSTDDSGTELRLPMAKGTAVNNG